MNPAAILGLISDLVTQIGALNEQIAQLRAEVAKTTQTPEGAST